MFYVQEILDNCSLIRGRIKEHGITDASFASSLDNQDLLAMPMLRVCELAARFEDDLGELEPDYDWPAMARMRNQIAHPYGGFDFGFVWEAAKQDIPELAEVCTRILGSA
jgi:uncharacterized protein with HEPN domain